MPGGSRTHWKTVPSHGALQAANIPGGHRRLFRVGSVYTDARTTGAITDHIHQYCRTIDGLILSEPGKGRQQFKSRTELFIGAGHHDLMGDLYDIRSAVEHLHDYRYLERFNRAVRLDLVKKGAIAEYIARTALAHIIGTPSLWPHFGNSPALEKFWSLPAAERQQLWASRSIRWPPWPISTRGISTTGSWAGDSGLRGVSTTVVRARDRAHCVGIALCVLSVFKPLRKD